MSFDFELPFPAIPNGAVMQLVHPQATLPGAISTDPVDVTIWAGGGVSLQAIAAGALRYVPPSGAATAGALAIETRYVPWPWATLVDEADYLTPDHIPATIYYENVDRGSLEGIVRSLIRAKCGNKLPAPEDSLVDDFFAGKWVGLHRTGPNEELIIQPLTVKPGTTLGAMRAGPVQPIQPGLPNAVTLKLRKGDGASAIDITDIVIAAHQSCRAHPDWSHLFKAFDITVFPVSTKTLKGQVFLSLLQMKDFLAQLRTLLEVDRALFSKDLIKFDTDRNHTDLLLTYLSNVDSLYPPLHAKFSDPCNLSVGASFDLETLFLNIRLIDTYRFLHQVRLYVGYFLIPQSTRQNELQAWKNVRDDLDLKMAQFNTALSEIQANPNWTGRSDIVNKVVVAELNIQNLQDILINFSAVRVLGFVAGIVSLVDGMISATGALQNLANALRNGGGFGFLRVAAAGADLEGIVYLGNGGTYTLSIAEINALVVAGVITTAGANVMMMAAQGPKFNPSGKNKTGTSKWVRRNRPTWKEEPAEGKGTRWIDEKGVEQIRYMRPDPEKVTPYGKYAKGVFRLQNEFGHMLDQNGNVVCRFDDQGRLNAYTGLSSGATRAELVTSTAPPTNMAPGTLSNGAQYIIANTADELEELTHIIANHAEVP